jgi:hypothetical protein
LSYSPRIRDLEVLSHGERPSPTLGAASDTGGSRPLAAWCYHVFERKGGRMAVKKRSGKPG